MKKSGYRQKILLGVILLLLSVFFYVLHYAIFRDIHHILIYLVGDIAFVFIEVLLVTLIIHQVLSEREKRSMLKKLNMVIGAFFSEAGTELLKLFITFDPAAKQLTEQLRVNDSWTEEKFDQVEDSLRKHNYEVDSRKGDLEELRNFAKEKRLFLLALLENPNLLEHESFTELLWAIFHLTEELCHRPGVRGLPETDYKHLSGDITRSYRLIVREWLGYMEHLKNNYPYLFSLAVRTNPFNPDANVVVE